ncbi:MAG: hypothetical protein COT90_04595 [Candidatus Diapherotrites archaeon CG10_big_fil_rev_8_21_14_0_10_31_34]|nr:MAG: hypothetical protein COT90_04595 [Candidatus Diapherotrites archaeon CG10_big_fil_rev_8_21_14_0_10_31_34]PJA20880.1 MAG: hypothetical protein COX63_00585 [Candidatus Diapherotrites archaeon CG_4_10_14_0_2_um_filter_31_5]
MLFYGFWANLFSLNLQWFVELAMENILFVFIFIAGTFVYNKMKFSLKFFIVIIISYVSYIEFFDKIGIVILASAFLFVYYLGEVALLTFTGTISSIKDRVPLILTVYFIVMIILYNVSVFGQ